MKPRDKQVNLKHARTAEQLAVMRRIAKSGVCPFCPKALAQEHERVIYRDDGLWTVTENRWPYEGTKHHVLFIPKRHLRAMNDLTAKEMLALQDNLKWVCKKFHIRSGGFVMRFGDTELTGASVTHLHGHLVEPRPGHDPSFAVIRFRLSAKEQTKPTRRPARRRPTGKKRQ